MGARQPAPRRPPPPSPLSQAPRDPLHSDPGELKYAGSHRISGPRGCGGSRCSPYHARSRPINSSGTTYPKSAPMSSTRSATSLRRENHNRGVLPRDTHRSASIAEPRSSRRDAFLQHLLTRCQPTGGERLQTPTVRAQYHRPRVTLGRLSRRATGCARDRACVVRCDRPGPIGPRWCTPRIAANPTVVSRPVRDLLSGSCARARGELLQSRPTRRGMRTTHRSLDSSASAALARRDDR